MQVVQVLTTFLFAIAVLFLVGLLLALLGVIGMELHWVFRNWSGHGPDDPQL